MTTLSHFEDFGKPINEVVEIILKMAIIKWKKKEIQI